MTSQALPDALRMRNLASAFRGRLGERIAAAAELPHLEREKAWLADADRLLETNLAALDALLERSQRLPEREPERELFARRPQAAWVAALEKLWADLAFQLGRRSPLIEALFPHTKFQALRRPRPELVRAYAAAFQKRLSGAYVQRILENDGDFARPQLEALAAALAAYEDTLVGPSLPDDQAELLRGQLQLATRKLAVGYRQSKHLLEAALLAMPLPEAEEEVQAEVAAAAAEAYAEPVPPAPEEPADPEGDEPAPEGEPGDDDEAAA